MSVPYIRVPPNTMAEQGQSLSPYPDRPVYGEVTLDPDDGRCVASLVDAHDGGSDGWYDLYDELHDHRFATLSELRDALAEYLCVDPAHLEIRNLPGIYAEPTAY